MFHTLINNTKLKIMTEESLKAMHYDSLKFYLKEMKSATNSSRKFWATKGDCQAQENLTFDNGKIDAIEKIESFINILEK